MNSLLLFKELCRSISVCIDMIKLSFTSLSLFGGHELEQWQRGRKKKKKSNLVCVFFNGWLHGKINPHHSESREWWLRCESVPRTTSTLSAEQAPWTEPSHSETPLQEDVTENVTSSPLFKHIMCEPWSCLKVELLKLSEIIWMYECKIFENYSLT